MKKIILLVFLAAVVSGCAGYKFQQGKSPYDKGYVAARDGYSILEYTIGKDNTVPGELALAKERFKRRRKIVERYYKQMGYIDNRFKEAAWDPVLYFVKFVTGVFRLPALAISDYRYRHNLKYRVKVQLRDEEQDLREETLIKKLHQGLNAYIQKDLEWEQSSPAPAVSTAALPSPKTENLQTPQVATFAVTAKPKANKPKAVKPKITKAKAVKAKPAVVSSLAPAETPARGEKMSAVLEKMAVSQPSAVIIARPQRGYSPLRVRFYGGNSRSPSGRIISYAWDFGDGDTSVKKNPVNTFWSSTYDPRSFTVKLTVTDDKGNSATQEKAIEVLNK